MASKPQPPTDLPIVQCKSSRAWNAWLVKNQALSAGVWLKIGKGDFAATTVSYAQALEVALCHGWIDGQKKPFDEAAWLQRFTPRGPRSMWSRKNRDAAEALILAGRMQPAGLVAIARAKANGRWDSAYEPASASSVPDDLQAALAASPKASAFFSTLRGSNRYAILYRVQTARKPETRAKRIAEFIHMLELGQKIHP